jgi:hypothetical protein
VSAIVVLLVVDLGKTDDLKAHGGRRVSGRGGLLHHYLGPDLRWTSVKAALAAGTSSQRPRFQRVRHGIYQRAR